MLLSEVQKHVTAGDNLFLVNGRIYKLLSIHEDRPKRQCFVENIMTGTTYWRRPIDFQYCIGTCPPGWQPYLFLEDAKFHHRHFPIPSMLHDGTVVYPGDILVSKAKYGMSGEEYKYRGQCANAGSPYLAVEDSQGNQTLIHNGWMDGLAKGRNAPALPLP